jgi:TRAP-type C4-dicarboxylate transport system permease small subunit
VNTLAAKTPARTEAPVSASPVALLLRAERVLGIALRGFSIACLVAIALLLLLNMVARATGLFGMNWFDEVVATVFAWLVFIGASALWREREHFAIDLVPELLRDTALARPLRVVIALLGLLFAVVLMVYGAMFVDRAVATTPVLELPQAWVYACLPVAGLLMTGYALRDLWQALRRKPRTHPDTPADGLAS